MTEARDVDKMSGVTFVLKQKNGTKKEKKGVHEHEQRNQLPRAGATYDAYFTILFAICSLWMD